MQTIAPDDKIIGLASSGPHSNGYSLIRKVLEVTQSDLQTPLDDRKLVDWLLAPTRIYVKPVLSLLETVNIKGMAHITGGGLTENLPRVMPAGTQANIDLNSWTLPKVFSWLQQGGNIATDEMLRTFNCGIGMAIVVAANECDKAVEWLNAQGESAFVIGDVSAQTASQQESGLQADAEATVVYSGSW